MVKWEYKIIDLFTKKGLEKKLNELGEEGWELVNTFANSNGAVLKRKKR